MTDDADATFEQCESCGEEYLQVYVEDGLCEDCR
jgi:hypothetical protein